METVYLSLGGNMGDTRTIFHKAIRLIESRIGLCVKKSHLYQTEPWGFSSDKLFLNQVLAVETRLEPVSILKQCLQIEAELGRTRSGKGYESRIIDIDILFIGNKIIDQPDLKVPHPLIAKRNFVLKPMCEIAPDFIHAVMKESIAQLCSHCTDSMACVRIDE